MTIQAPTRITIEVHPATGDGDAALPIVHVIPAGPSAAQPVVAGALREDVPGPAAFDPGPCHCLDDEDCNADHAND